jgi:ureidoglycolate lyase
VDFAPFGQVIDTAGVQPEVINGGTTRRYSDLARLGEPVIGLYQASGRRFPLRLSGLERHVRAAQVFLPLGLHRFVIVVAPGQQEPDWEHVCAFLSDPGQGVSLHRGCWHHGLIALSDGDRFAVIDGATYRQDTQEIEAPLVLEILEPGSGTG